MYQANVIEVFIASPSDVIDERDLLEKVLQEWNAIHSKKNEIILQPIRWEKNVHSDFSDSPQEIINQQILENADILVAIFWSKIGTPTENHESGTVEELKTHIDAGKPAIVLFSKENLKQNHDQQQFNLLQDFKAWCQSSGVYFEYKNLDDFKDVSRNQLSLKLNSPDFNFPVYSSIGEAELSPKMSRAKQDAIEFIAKIPQFQNNPNKISEYFEEIGNYRSLKLNDFLKETELLSLLKHSGGFTISIQSTLNNMSSDDLQLFHDDVVNGEYDYLL
ncbi:DUF4062 domain-containing protein [bacterium]|nr:DUF4062 domain-containing protein [bacterium]